MQFNTHNIKYYVYEYKINCYNQTQIENVQVCTSDETFISVFYGIYEDLGHILNVTKGVI